VAKETNIAEANPEAGKLTDQEILDRILGGETELFGILYDRYANKVYRKCLSIVKDQSTAQDLVHDIMIKVFTSLPKFQGRSKFGSWVYAITYNKCIDFVRNRKKVGEVELDDDREGIEDDSEEMPYADIVAMKADRLRELMWELQEVDRVVLLMKYQDELSVQEIEEALDIKSSAVKMRLKRARERLKALYRERYGDDD
jgi:RNA polymerase sigma-70 factor (ECF subfamily)